MSYANHKANIEAEATAWLEENAHVMADDRNGENSLAYSEEYFHLEGLESTDYDDLDYYTRLGVYAVSAKKVVDYIVQPEHEAPALHPKFEESAHANIYSDDLTDASILMRGVKVEALPYQGQPVSRYVGGVRKAKSVQQVVAEGRARENKKRTTRMDRLRAKADRKAK